MSVVKHLTSLNSLFNWYVLDLEAEVAGAQDLQPFLGSIGWIQGFHTDDGYCLARCYLAVGLGLPGFQIHNGNDVGAGDEGLVIEPGDVILSSCRLCPGSRLSHQ